MTLSIILFFKLTAKLYYNELDVQICESIYTSLTLRLALAPISALTLFCPPSTSLLAVSIIASEPNNLHRPAGRTHQHILYRRLRMGPLLSAWHFLRGWGTGFFCDLVSELVVIASVPV
jgi:hypothetical protein